MVYHWSSWRLLWVPTRLLWVPRAYCGSSALAVYTSIYWYVINTFLYKLLYTCVNLVYSYIYACIHQYIPVYIRNMPIIYWYIISKSSYGYTRLFHWNGQKKSRTMIPLYEIMHDYLAIILPLYTIIFSIFYDYLTASAPGKWECADSNSWPNHGGMTG